ncbi:13775_t:CDS:10, partial [Dentiscutata heterogama]
YKNVKKDILIDKNESLGLVLFYETESTKDICIPDILKVIFVQRTENLCFIEKNEEVKLFSIGSMQLLTRTLKFPPNIVNVLSSPDGTCVIAFTNDGFLNSKAYIYFLPFSEESQKGVEELKFCHLSYIIDKQIHLCYIDLNKSCFKSFLTKISVNRIELQFQRVTKLSLGFAKPKPLESLNNYSEITGKETNFQSDFEVGDCITIENENKLVTEIISNNCLKIEVSNQPMIDDGTNKAPQLSIFLERELALDYKKNFEDYINNMLERVKISTRKPADLLNQFKTYDKPYQDLFDDSVIRQQYASKIQLGEWIIQLCCLIPIQITIAKENKLVPLYNGLDVPENYNIKYDKDKEDCTDLISRKISFGWYEGIFKYLGDRKVKVISSMGEQSCGKSYLINHLAGTNFDGSAMRCTEGAWMSLTIKKEVVYVTLDFEGIGSSERHQQEDLLLTLLNASLSNMILFKNQFVINRHMSSTFQSFQNGANRLKNDYKIFKARLCMIIKDVPKHARKEIKKEFEQKFQKIVAK